MSEKLCHLYKLYFLSVSYHDVALICSAEWLPLANCYSLAFDTLLKILSKSATFTS